MDSPDRTGPSSVRSPTWTWLLPVLTFLLGCLLAGVVVGVGASAGSGPADAAPAASAGPQEADDDRTPAASAEDGAGGADACVRAAEGALAASQEVDDVVAAVRDLDARRLQEIVDRIQQTQPRLERLAQQCRDTAGRSGSSVADGPTASPDA